MQGARSGQEQKHAKCANCVVEIEQDAKICYEAKDGRRFEALDDADLNEIFFLILI